MLLGGLEDEAHRAVEVPPLGQQPRGAQRHGHVAVVPAGMHAARIARGVGAALVRAHCLGDGQRIHVGPDADGAPAHAGLEAGHHARAADAPAYLQAQGLEDAGHVIGRALFVEAGFGVLVQMAAPAHELAGKVVGGGVVHGVILGAPPWDISSQCRPIAG
jgi:hypothetical protein